MSRRLIFITAIILAILGGSFYFFTNSISNPLVNNQKKQGETIQFLPFPVIISNDTGEKNNILYEMLINKSDSPVAVSGGAIDFSGLVSKQNLSYHNLFINFSYDAEDEKVNFHGHIPNNQQEVKIKGSYGFNQNKQIEFDIDLSDGGVNTKLNAVFLPSAQGVEDGFYTGSFSVHANDLWNSMQFFYEMQKIFGIAFKKDFVADITGEFILKNKYLSVKDVKFVSEAINFDLSYKQSDAENDHDNMILNINKLNFDEIITSSKGSNIRKIRNIAAYLFGDYNVFGPISGVVKAPEIVFDGSSINNFNLNYSCDDKNQINIDDISFKLGEGSVFTSKGVLSSNKYRPSYKGSINYEIKTPIAISKVSKILNGYTDEISGIVKANVLLTPVMLQLSDYQLKGGQVESNGNVRLSYYGNNFKSVYSNIAVANLDSAKKQSLVDLINVVSEDDKKTDSFAKSLMNFKKFNSIYDINLTVKNTKLIDHMIEKAQARFVLRNNNFHIHNIKIHSDSSNISGQFGINVEGPKPYFTCKMKGDYIDGSKIFNFLDVDNKSSAKIDSSKESSASDVAYNIPDKDIRSINLQDFDGYINFDFKQVDFNDSKVRDFFFDAVINDELMKVRKLNMSIYKGYLQSLGNVTFNPLAFNMAYSYAGGDVGEISQKIFDSKRFSGGLNMTGNIYGKGTTTHDLIQSIGGSFSFKFNKLLAKKFNLKNLLATYGTSVPEYFDNKIDAGSTFFNSFVGKAIVNKGLLEIKDAAFSTKYSDGKVSSQVKLLNGDQNSLVSFAFIDKKGKVDGFNISFTGPVNKPKVSLGVAASSN